MSIKKIIIISDTHMRLSAEAEEAVKGLYSYDQIYDSQIITKGKEQIAELTKFIKSNKNSKPDLIIHAGDVGYQNIVDILQSIAPIKVVNGNCDFQSFRTIEGETTDYLYFDFEGVKISLGHSPYDLETYEEPEWEINMHVHGHTHESYIKQIGSNEINICPGSATMGRYGTPNSIACVYVSNGKILLAQLIKV